MAAGFEEFAISWRKDVFDGAPQAGSAASFGTLGINFGARKPVAERESQPASGGEMPPLSAGKGRSGDGFDVDAETLRDMLERGEPVAVVDVRKVEDRAEWSVPGSVHFDAYDALNAGDERAMDGLHLQGDVLVVTVCGRGRSSAVAADQLRRRGLKALSLESGMKAWSLAWNTAGVPVSGSAAEVVQVRRTGKGCLSYLVASGGEAAVVDASVDPKVYLDLAEERDLAITRVLDTHVHADHLSRSRVLAELTGATLHMPAGSQVSYPFAALADGGELGIGEAKLRVIGTPGHTPESTSYLLDGGALLTGDTLFLSAVGRPDLGVGPEEVREKARSLHASLGRLLSLDAGTLVLSGHTGEPVHFDGMPIAATISEVRENTPLLGESEAAFEEKLVGNAAPTPENHERIVKMNRTGKWTEGDPAELEAGANRCAAG
ncbi:rhodanese-like domain-containing protein [soil metagenome]